MKKNLIGGFIFFTSSMKPTKIKEEQVKLQNFLKAHKIELITEKIIPPLVGVGVMQTYISKSIALRIGIKIL